MGRAQGCDEKAFEGLGGGGALQLPHTTCVHRGVKQSHWAGNKWRRPTIGCVAVAHTEVSGKAHHRVGQAVEVRKVMEEEAPAWSWV